MKTTVKSLQDNGFQLGLFPGKVSSLKGEEAERLLATVTITIKDRVTGEQMRRVIPFVCTEVDELVSWIQCVMTHERTASDLESFTEGRDG